MAEDDKDGFGGEYETNSHRAHLSAYVLIAGLVLEIINAAIWFKGLETLAEMVAVLLIVGGVWGEVFFGNRARIAGDRQLAQYEARTAEANQKAQEAALELAKFRVPRFRLLQEGSNTETLTKALLPFARTKFDVGHEKIGREQWDFLWVFEPILAKAGWVHADWIGPDVFGKNNWPGAHVYGVANVSNVSIEVHPGCPEQLTAAAMALAGALRSIGIDAQTGDFNNASQNADAIHILVGNKE